MFYEVRVSASWKENVAHNRKKIGRVHGGDQHDTSFHNTEHDYITVHNVDLLQVFSIIYLYYELYLDCSFQLL